jgi:hypothetical protein
LTDSYLRLGDCQFVTSKYWPAMEAYNKAIDMKGVDADYAFIKKSNLLWFCCQKKKLSELNFTIVSKTITVTMPCTN